MEPKKVVKVFSIIMVAITVLIVGMTYGDDEFVDEVYSKYNMATQGFNKTYMTSVSDALGNASTTPVAPIVPGTTPTTGTNHNHVAYRQTKQSWSPYRVGTTTISRGGCGVCTMAHGMSYLGFPMNPQEFLENMAKIDSKFGMKGWGDGLMDWDAPELLVETLNKSGAYGQYEIPFKIEGRVLRNEEFANALNTYLDDPNTFIMVSANERLFTTSGHIMCIVDFADESKTSFHLVDSSGQAAKNMGITWEDAQKVAWPVNDPDGKIYGWTASNQGSYHFKCLWVIRRIS